MSAAPAHADEQLEKEQPETSPTPSSRSANSKQESPTETSADFPDGGLAAWTAVLGGWCCCLCSYGWLSSIGVFQTYYEQDLLRSYSSSTIAWIISVQVWALTVAAPFNGKIFDNYGARGLIIVGTFLHVFGLMMISISDQYYQIFLAQAVCSGFGSAALYHGGINAVSTWFQQRRGLALGLVASGASIGGVIIPEMFNHLIGNIGFGWTMRAIAFMFLGLQCIAIVTVKSRLQHVPQPTRLLEFIAPFTEPTFLLNAIGCFFVFWGILIPFNYITLAAEASGMSRSLADNLIPIVNGASFFGRVFPPWAGDHIGRFNTAIVFTLFGSILSMALWIPTTSNPNVQNIVFGAFYGIPLGVFAAILPALVGQISDVRHIGVRLGATFFVTSWAGLTGNPIAGALVKTSADGTPDYRDLKIFCGVTVAVGAVFLAAARFSQAGLALKKKT